MPGSAAAARPGPELDRRALGRATLARQLLLERSTTPLDAAVEHLVGLQAQTPHTWYVGLWSRLADFSAGQAGEALERRGLVRVALMRSTIHLVTAADCLRVRPLLQPVLERALTGSAYGRLLAGLDLAEVAATGRALVEASPLTLGELGAALAREFPDRDPDALAQAVRAWATLVQVPPRGVWGRSGKAVHTTAEHWLGRRRAPGRALTLDALVLRYLAAFGPASVRDVQVWSGLTRLAEVVDRLRARGRLVRFRDAAGVELYDQPDGPRPDPDVPAPVRFLYDYDNLLLSHADRSRVMSEEYRALPPPANGVLYRGVLVDGLVTGVWTAGTDGDRAVLEVRPLVRWSRPVTAEVVAEGAALLAFLHPGKVADVRMSHAVAGH